MPPTLKRLVIGAPFGNYVNNAQATSTIGTYTNNFRGGWGRRLWRMLLTLRYDRHVGGWVNKLGLPNPGIHELFKLNLANWLSTRLLSIHGFHTEDWRQICERACKLPVMGLELNCSCPNVKDDSVNWRTVFSWVVQQWGTTQGIIVKLPPVNWRTLAIQACDAGIHAFHCCNTIPGPRGGVSGPLLRQFSLEVIRDLDFRMSGQKKILIGGGGISKTDHILEYIDAGATHFAVASHLLNPLHWADLDIFADFIDAYVDYPGEPSLSREEPWPVDRPTKSLSNYSTP